MPSSFLLSLPLDREKVNDDVDEELGESSEKREREVREYTLHLAKDLWVNPKIRKRQKEKERMREKEKMG